MENDSQQMTTCLNLIEKYQQITKQQSNEKSLYQPKNTKLFATIMIRESIDLIRSSESKIIAQKYLLAIKNILHGFRVIKMFTKAGTFQ